MRRLDDDVLPRWRRSLDLPRRGYAVGMVEHRRRRLAADRKVAGLGQMLDSRVQLAGERDGALEDGGRQPVGVVGHDQAAYRPVAEDDPFCQV